jgi:hypothetical protein
MTGVGAGAVAGAVTAETLFTGFGEPGVAVGVGAGVSEAGCAGTSTAARVPDTLAIGWSDEHPAAAVIVTRATTVTIQTLFALLMRLI